MPVGIVKLISIGIALASLTSSALGAEMGAAAINLAEPSTKNLSTTKATPASVRLQVLLDRAHFSPGRSTASSVRTRRRHCGHSLSSIKAWPMAVNIGRPAWASRPASGLSGMT
jgi:hypothetical protein